MHIRLDFGVRIGLKYFIRYIPKNSAASRGNELKTNDTIIQVGHIGPCFLFPWYTLFRIPQTQKHF